MNLKEALQKRNQYKKFIGKPMPDKLSVGMIVEDIVVAPSNDTSNFMLNYHSVSEKDELYNERLLGQYPLSLNYTLHIIYNNSTFSPDGVDSWHETLEEYIKRNSE